MSRYEGVLLQGSPRAAERVAQWFKDHGVDPSTIEGSVQVHYDGDVATVTWSGVLAVPISDAQHLLHPVGQNTEGEEVRHGGTSEQ